MFDFLGGETLLVDKPLNWTSFDVVNKLRWNLKKKLGVKNIKVGHAGTLDPLATGLLIICTGKKTKTIDQLIVQDKTYTGTFLVGKTTPSFDLETSYDQDFPIDHITEELIEKVRISFLGETDQTPPIFSAKQVDGKRAYDLARAGKEVIIKPNKILIKEFVITKIDLPKIDFSITCSKGTYIRTIANDFGKKLNSGATLIALKRIGSGDFNLTDSKSVEEWIDTIYACD